MSQSPHIESFTLGPWMTNCYVVHDPDGKACWIVDVGFEPGEMIGYIERQNLTPKQVILTHGHLDHVGGLEAVLATWPDLPVLIHEAEKDFPGDANLNLSAPFGMPMVAREPTGTIEAGTTQTIGEASFEVRHTPGHSPGGISLYCEAGKVVIAGDTLFAGSIGRFDFPTSDEQALFRSIREQLYTLPDETQVLPGHGPATTIGSEKQSNPFVR